MQVRLGARSHPLDLLGPISPRLRRSDQHQAAPHPRSFGSSACALQDLSVVAKYNAEASRPPFINAKRYLVVISTMASTTQLGLASTALLGPVISLNLWTFVMGRWLKITRFAHVKKAGLTPRPEVTPIFLATTFPPEVRWKAENFNHLHEQPTTFYAVALSLTLLGVDDPYTVGAAWTYTGLRIVHSLVHATCNHISTRFRVFIASSGVLCGMALRAAYVLVRQRK